MSSITPPTITSSTHAEFSRSRRYLAFQITQLAIRIMPLPGTSFAPTKPQLQANLLFSRDVAARFGLRAAYHDVLVSLATAMQHKVWSWLIEALKDGPEYDMDRPCELLGSMRETLLEYLRARAVRGESIARDDDRVRALVARLPELIYEFDTLGFIADSLYEDLWTRFDSLPRVVDPLPNPPIAALYAQRIMTAGKALVYQLPGPGFLDIGAGLARHGFRNRKMAAMIATAGTMHFWMRTVIETVIAEPERSVRLDFDHLIDVIIPNVKNGS
ncbi:hypothetical protein ANO11243_077870 [Dothideomycetidae sp. 11243]|nr:hypothetical protein ANO11243_077870 [fungal sp. No.11243]